MVYALILAGGTGTRVGGDMPKQFLPLGGVPLLARTLAAFEKHLLVDGIFLAAPPALLEESREIAAAITKLVEVLPGGETRQDSCRLALEGMAAHMGKGDMILIHDGARPFVDGETIGRCIHTVKEQGAANTVYPQENTILLSRDGIMMDTVPDRDTCYTVQTPQGFFFAELLEAHRRCAAMASPPLFTDDCTLYAAMLQKPVYLCMGTKENIKITTRADFWAGEAYLAQGK
ncbi:2-C-methyl-D-erythritol 4-phosphate cytidylyltransferase [Eubacteriales bacterium OttesenSCG-928-M02]|nr:2-C-methyl-D-erythritol 4-phosphate cytidylyltransferase [Eubacteriales bacterium OttesenSCG-928-M02]